MLGRFNLPMGRLGIGLVPISSGSSGSAVFLPENMMASIRAEADHGVMLAEVDLVVLGDGTLILHHTDTPFFGDGCHDPGTPHAALKIPPRLTWSR